MSKNGSKKIKTKLDKEFFGALQTASPFMMNGSIFQYTGTPDGARLATLEEYRGDLTEISIDDVSDIPQGGMVMHSDGKHALIDTSDSHSIVISATGSRKTTLLVIPSIYSIARAGESAFIADPKGEIFDATTGIFESKGYNIKRIDLRDLVHSSKWNPLTIPYLWYRSEDINLRNAGETMMVDFIHSICPVESKNDPYWENAARNALVGATLILFRYCDDVSQVNLRSLSTIIRLIIQQNKELVEFVKGLEDGDTIKESLEAVIRLPDNTRQCVTGVAKVALVPFTVQDSVASLLSEDEIHLDRIIEDKTVVFITTPDERTTYNAIVSCFVKQSYEILIHQAESCEGRTLPRRVNYFIDEFATFPRIPDFESMISAARSRNIRFTMVLQGLTQLYNVYGANSGSNILGNCGNIFFLTSRENELLQSIVRLGGKKSNGKDLFTVADLQRLDKEQGECVVFHGRCHPFISTFVRFDAWAASQYDAESLSLENELKIPEIFSIERLVPKVSAGSKNSFVTSNPIDDAIESLREIESKRMLAIGTLQSKCARKTEFHRIVDDCLEHFDYFDGLDGLSLSIKECLTIHWDSDEWPEQIKKNKGCVLDYPKRIATEILSAFDLIFDLYIAYYEECPVLTVIDDECEEVIELVKEVTSNAPLPINKDILSFNIFEALVVKYRSKETILEKNGDTDYIIESLNEIEKEGYLDAMRKVRILNAQQIAEILDILDP